MPAWLLPAAIAGTGILNTLAQERANRQNMELAKYKFKTDKAMWEMQNQYNSPVAQMLRLTEAGLSPHLVYGGGNVTGNSAGTAPQFQPARMAPVQVPEMMSQYIAAKQANAQIELTNSQRNLADAEALNKALSAPGIKADSFVKTKGKELQLEILGNTAGSTSMDKDLKKSQILLNDLDSQIKNWEIKLQSQGFTKNDQVYWRLIINELIDAGLTPGQIRQKFDNTAVGRYWHEITGGLFKGKEGN